MKMKSLVLLAMAIGCGLVAMLGVRQVLSGDKGPAVETAKVLVAVTNIMPGQPLVFGQARGKFFFGLPGNPASTMVTFEIFARAAVELLGGQSRAGLPLLWSRLSKDFSQKKGLTRFLPAVLSADGAEIEPLAWQGSGDVPTLTRANAFLVTEPERETWAAGDWIRVLLK